MDPGTLSRELARGLDTVLPLFVQVQAFEVSY